jgi:hypothetical protein
MLGLEPPRPQQGIDGVRRIRCRSGGRWAHRQRISRRRVGRCSGSRAPAPAPGLGAIQVGAARLARRAAPRCRHPGASSAC